MIRVIHPKTAMPATTESDLSSLSQLPRTPASDVKKHGWRGLMRTLQAEGSLLVTNHDEPEAVILSVKDYAAFVRLAQQSEASTETALQVLRQRFDERLAALQGADAADRLRAIMGQPTRLDGTVKVGATY